MVKGALYFVYVSYTHPFYSILFLRGIVLVRSPQHVHCNLLSAYQTSQNLHLV